MVFVWFGSQGNISLIKWVKNYFLPIFCKKLCIIQCLTELFSDTEFGDFFFKLKLQIFHRHHDFIYLWPLLWGEMRRDRWSPQWGLGTDSRCFQSTVPLHRSRFLHLRAGQQWGAGSCAVWTLQTDLSISAASSLLHS